MSVSHLSLVIKYTVNSERLTYQDYEDTSLKPVDSKWANSVCMIFMIHIFGRILLFSLQKSVPP
jgi:hypothetical protein